MLDGKENEFLHDLCAKTLRLDKTVRFAGIMDDNGRLLVGKYRKNVIPLISPTGEKSNNSFYAAYKSLTLKKNFESDLGEIHFQLTEFEKVILVTIPLTEQKNRYLCISLDPESLYQKVVKEIFDKIL